MGMGPLAFISFRFLYLLAYNIIYDFCFLLSFSILSSILSIRIPIEQRIMLANASHDRPYQRLNQIRIVEPMEQTRHQNKQSRRVSQFKETEIKNPLINDSIKPKPTWQVGLWRAIWEIYEEWWHCPSLPSIHVAPFGRGSSSAYITSHTIRLIAHHTFSHEHFKLVSLCNGSRKWYEGFAHNKTGPTSYLCTY